MDGLREQNNILATKQDVIAIKQDLADFEARLSKKIGGIRSDMVKWMFIFWIGQVAVTFGFILLFLKK
jgi:hypothetical protein